VNPKNVFIPTYDKQRNLIAVSGQNLYIVPKTMPTGTGPRVLYYPKFGTNKVQKPFYVVLKNATSPKISVKSGTSRAVSYTVRTKSVKNFFTENVDTSSQSLNALVKSSDSYFMYQFEGNLLDSVSDYIDLNATFRIFDNPISHFLYSIC
jgi:hypothetical protein